jgi:hypothetical protein
VPGIVMVMIVLSLVSVFAIGFVLVAYINADDARNRATTWTEYRTCLTEPHFHHRIEPCQDQLVTRCHRSRSA